MLTATGINKTINGRRILADVDFALAPGSITAIIGPSGAGKTSLLRALAMIDVPESGRVTCDDQAYNFPVPELGNPPPPWPNLTIVFQQLFLWPHLTLAENILLGVANKLTPAVQQERLQELAGLMNMTEFLGRYPNEASIGQRQRVALARALILRPRYILLDEITSALDIEQAAKILQLLLSLKARGIGMALITHSINFARRAADNIVFMEDGRVTASGGPELITAPPTPRLREFLNLVEAAS